MSTDFNPKFLYKNLINDVSTITTFGDGIIDNDANKIKLFDRNEEITWASLGSTTGASRGIIWTPNEPVSFDRIFLQNINWKEFYIYGQLPDGNGQFPNGTWAQLYSAYNTNENFYINNLSSYSIDYKLSKIKFNILSTFLDGDVVRCGQLYIGNKILEIPSTVGGNVNVNAEVSQFVSKLADGTAYKNYIRSTRSYSLNLQGAGLTERESLKKIFDINRYAPIVFIPNPATYPDKWDGLAGHFNIANAPDYDRYTGNCKINGYDINMNLVQASGIA